MRYFNLYFLFPALILFFFSCKKKEVLVPLTENQLSITVNYAADGKDLRLNKMNYFMPAGYRFSVGKLCYYLSGISLIRADSTLLRVNDLHYFEFGNISSNEIKQNGIEPGNYIGLSFLIGLEQSCNVSNALPAESDNINMQWPNNMGGGYHFLKMEGQFVDSNWTHGYAMHVGNVKALPVNIYMSLEVKEGSNTLSLQMNVNEWFRNPCDIDFNTDGNYIMGNETMMKKFLANGYDVFSVK